METEEHSSVVEHTVQLANHRDPSRGEATRSNLSRWSVIVVLHAGEPRRVRFTQAEDFRDSRGSLCFVMKVERTYFVLKYSSVAGHS